jgi:hypothetical protein
MTNTKNDHEVIKADIKQIRDCLFSVLVIFIFTMFAMIIGIWYIIAIF